jgi:CRP-like cAMP-binding protein
MTLKKVKAGETVIKEGESGDEMYIIDNGVFTVFKKDENGVSQEVFKYTNRYLCTYV